MQDSAARGHFVAVQVCDDDGATCICYGLQSVSIPLKVCGIGLVLRKLHGI